MIKRHIFMVMAAVLIAAAFPASSEDPEELTVYAAASLTGAFGEIGEIFENETGIKVAFNFDGSQALRTQIENGAYADVFASANKKQMNALLDSELINNSSMVIFARNKIALIIPKDNPAQINNLSDLARPGVKIVMGTKDVPVGDYAMQIISNLANDSSYGPDYNEKVLANVISEETNVNYVVTKVALGEADVGFAYVSDITEDLAGKVEKIEIPDEYNVIGEYPIGIAQGSMYPEQAWEFLDLVLSDEGREVLERHGFSSA
ncbi:MAG: molybdate ABC transporter substrate-binding protein [Methanothrix sp.]